MLATKAAALGVSPPAPRGVRADSADSDYDDVAGRFADLAARVWQRPMSASMNAAASLGSHPSCSQL